MAAKIIGNLFKFELIVLLVFLCSNLTLGQTQFTMLRLPDTGQSNSYTATFGEDNDYNIYVPFFIVNGNGTVTDTITTLLWQQKDGGEMTIENASLYCDTLTLGGFTDWRLPNNQEAFSILNHQFTNPALNTNVFTKTAADYWWSSDKQVGDVSKVWCTNAGGGIGNHPKLETISGGGTKKFHVRAVRNIGERILDSHYSNFGNETLIDNATKLLWQKTLFPTKLTWEQALTYADTLSFADYTDWRVPNIKELHSIAETYCSNPAVNKAFFAISGKIKIWSSTTLPNEIGKAWYLDTQYGITTYDDKTNSNYLICVRGPFSLSTGLKLNSAAIKEISVFPNPANDIVAVQSDGLTTSDLKVELFDMSGRLIQTSSIFQGSTIAYFDTRTLYSGEYIIKVSSETELYIKKLVITK